eukprot:TRINITY_DN101275_c0_g1_i6.p1 TRINITY_DN101275_c0_g1~~TRINITY_DN101275_c0_g1_i6.p1  ORF type:complete len:220 (+),score=48.22 TRINITY_DN101275_c0_g1_i6:179-838(+)
MPSSAVHFRAVCGSFLPVYIGFMFKRAKEKAALRIAIVTLRRRVDGVIFGMLLTYFFWGSFLLRCGDVESNPGPPAPPTSYTDAVRKTRLSTAGANRKGSTDKASDSPSPSAGEPTLRDVMATLTDMRQQMGTHFNELKQDVQDLRQDCATLHSELRGLREEVTELRRENDDLKKTNYDLSEKLTDYERRMDDLEGRSKRNNLILLRTAQERRRDECRV